jgi:hypothetical protein
VGFVAAASASAVGVSSLVAVAVVARAAFAIARLVLSVAAVVLSVVRHLWISVDVKGGVLCKTYQCNDGKTEMKMGNSCFIKLCSSYVIDTAAHSTYSHEG